MNETNPNELSKAISIFHEKYGAKTLIDTHIIDKIILVMREQAKKKPPRKSK